MKFTNYNGVLGVRRDATVEDAKRIDRQLAEEPQSVPQPAAERVELLQEINATSEVLADGASRSQHDSPGDNSNGWVDYTAPSGWSSSAEEWGDFSVFSDFFVSLFAGKAVRCHEARITVRGRHVEAELPLALEDLLHPGRRRITLSDGRTLDVEIPRGVHEGTVIRLVGQGEAGREGPPGDLHLHVRVLSHPRYRVSGDDLETDLPLWPWQAVLGGSVRVETPTWPVTVHVPAGTQSGRRLPLWGMGLPRADGSRGDLYARVRIVVPEQMSAGEREAYEALRHHATVPSKRPERK